MGLPNSWPDPEFVPKFLWGSRGRPGGVLGPLGGVLGRLGGVLGTLGGAAGRLGAVLGPSWGRTPKNVHFL